MAKDKRCVYVANTQASAIGVSHWLEQVGIENILVDKTTLGFSYGVSFTSSDPAADGWQIWVKDPGQIERALELIAVRDQRRQDRRKLGEIEATCEECGQGSFFSGSQRGTVQNCPHCGRYMDVGGIDDEFEGIDFGTPEEP